MKFCSERFSALNSMRELKRNYEPEVSSSNDTNLRNPLLSTQDTRILVNIHNE